MYPDERWIPEGKAEAPAEQLVDAPDRERPDPEPGDRAIADGRRHSLDGRGRGASGCRDRWPDRRRLRPPAQEGDDRLGPDAADDELEGPERRPVEPLEVVDREEHRPNTSHGPDDADRRDRDRARLGPLVALAPEEGDLERSPLRSRELGEDGVVEAVEEVDEPGERQVGVARRGAGGEDAPRPPSCRGDGRLEERRLADPGLSLEEQTSQALVDRVEDALDRGELARPADHVGRRGPVAGAARGRPPPTTAGRHLDRCRAFLNRQGGSL